MRTELCDRFGIDYPIFVFTPSEKVAAAVSKAGGLGVLGCVRFNDADDLERVLGWMDENTDGKPYGVDVVMPAKIPTEGTAVDIDKLIPQGHRDFVAKTLADLGVPPLPEDEERSEGVLGWLHSVARSHVEVALKHPIKLIANALGSPPKDVIDQAHDAGVPVAALAGSAKHAVRHADNGVDIVVAQGHEAGGHTGEIGSVVLWPEVVDGLRALGHRTPVLAAGGIGTGRQVAAALALGASGVWMGSAFLTAAEYDLGHRRAGGTSTIQEALLRATSSDTVRRRIYTGKPARLLKTKWTEAWDAADAPEPLPMPLQNILVSEAHQRMNDSDNPDTVSMPVGQIVGRMNEVRPVADIIAELVRGFDEATGRLDAIRAG
jgi:NAD(P)H-dependent flavin oxidoreductase YrpB (nitropropane dioxygenase family)